jgi:catechol 2,3-dioxygenase-like lactoylglutathione lyase family enzyme
MRNSANPPLLKPDFPAPTEGFVVTTLLIVSDVARSRAFYERVFDAVTVREGEPAMLRIANSWLIINRGGGPTDDKPAVTAAPPKSSDTLMMALNLRVADVYACYDLWRSRGAEFLTEPKVHTGETRCYIRDPDGYLIEVGQMTANPSAS